MLAHRRSSSKGCFNRIVTAPTVLGQAAHETCIFLRAPVALVFGVRAASAQTLKTVKDRGALICGVSQGLPGFSNPDDKGNWTGFDVDFCRAIAAAIFNDPSKVKFTPLSAKDRFEPLKTGEIDLLSRNTTWTLSRDVAYGNFAGVTYYDGQGFMVRKALKVNSALELNGASICTQTGTTTELNLADYFRANNMKYEVIAFGTADETIKAYEAGRCDVFTTDVSQLYAEKLKLTNANDHVILPEIISKEPLGPLVRHGDDQWFDVVKWTLFAMLNAEELGVSSEERRRGAEVEPAGDQAAVGRGGQFRRAARADQGLGRYASSSRSATTEKCSSATSARVPSSASAAASTVCGPKAASSTRRRCGESMCMVRRRIVVTNVASRSWASANPRRGSGKHLYR